MMQSREYDLIVYAPSSKDIQPTIDQLNWVDDLIYQYRNQDVSTIVIDFDLMVKKDASHLAMVEVRPSESESAWVIYLLMQSDEQTEYGEKTYHRTIRWV